MEDILITERGYRDSCLGRVLQLKIFTPTYRLLSWREVWERFTDAYPGKWAIQCFPPRDLLIDGKNVYHLFVCDDPPKGLNLK